MRKLHSNGHLSVVSIDCMLRIEHDIFFAGRACGSIKNDFIMHFLPISDVSKASCFLHAESTKWLAYYKSRNPHTSVMLSHTSLFDL